MIPERFNWIWIGPKMPEWARDNIRLFETLNPSFGSEIYGEEVLLPEFEEVYRKISGEHLYARRSDLLRLSILSRHGGWYFDCDFLPIRPMSVLYEACENFSRRCFVTHGAYAGSRPWIANGVIGTTKGSPFLQAIHKEVVVRGAKASGWGAFGPALFTRQYELNPRAVHLGAIEDFYPLQHRVTSMRAYRRIREQGYSQAAIVAELGEPLPFAMHMAMQDELELPV